jgi:hypothetical protein
LDDISGWRVSSAPIPYPDNVHNAVSQIAFLSIMITEFLVWRRMSGIKTDKQQFPLGSYSYYSLVSGIMSVITYFLLFVFAGNPTGFVGLFQRLFLGVAWLWIEVIAIKLFRSSFFLGRTIKLNSSKL